MPKHTLPFYCALLAGAACSSDDDDAFTSSVSGADDGATGPGTSTSASSTTGATATSAGMSTGTASTSTSTTGPSTTGPGTTADGSSGDGSCIVSEECPDDEVCANDGSCVDALDCDYVLRILELTGVPCDDGVGAAEVSWMMWRGERLVYESQIDSCPLGWLGDAAPYVTTDQTAVWRFYEHDALADDELFYFCFDADCGPIPVEYLHDGGWAGTVDNGLYYLDIEILPIC